LLHLCDGRVARRERLRQLFGARQQRACVLALAFRHTDGLGIRIALCAHAVGFDLRRFAQLFEARVGGDVEREPAPREVGGDRGGVSAK
jgi:hypothetical protein